MVQSIKSIEELSRNAHAFFRLLYAPTSSLIVLHDADVHAFTNREASYSHLIRVVLNRLWCGKSLSTS